MSAWRAVLAALVLWTSAAAGAWAQTFPALSGRVVDAANILSPEAEARLTQRSAALEAQTGAQLVVATVASLEDYPIEDYANRLFRAWRLGQQEQNNGVLFLTAPNDRGVRIEVGYGLEPVLTDALSSVIIQGRVLPRFRVGELEAGVVAGAEAIAEQLGLAPEAARARVAEAQARAARDRSEAGGGAGGIVIALLALWFLFAALSSFGRRGRRHRRRGGLAGDVAQVVLWSMLSSRGGGGRGGGWGGGGFGGGFGGGGGSSGGGGASGSW